MLHFLHSANEKADVLANQRKDLLDCIEGFEA